MYEIKFAIVWAVINVSILTRLSIFRRKKWSTFRALRHHEYWVDKKGEVWCVFYCTDICTQKLRHREYLTVSTWCSSVGNERNQVENISSLVGYIYWTPTWTIKVNNRALNVFTLFIHQEELFTEVICMAFWLRSQNYWWAEAFTQVFERNLEMALSDVSFDRYGRSIFIVRNSKLPSHTITLFSVFLNFMIENKPRVKIRISDLRTIV